MATKITYILSKPTATTGADDFSPLGLTPAAMDQNLANLQADLEKLGGYAASQTSGASQIPVRQANGTLEIQQTSTTVPAQRLRYNASSYYLDVGMDGNGNSTLTVPSANGATGGRLVVNVSGNEALRIDTSGNLLAGIDNTQTFGSAAKRWSTVYAGTGTINTSDAREKTAVALLSANELAAAKALAYELGTFQFLDAVAEKGENARHHAGMTVQRAIEVMQAHGLDPFRYGFICYDEWDGGSRYSFRHDELLMFIARGFDARLAALEAA